MLVLSLIWKNGIVQVAEHPERRPMASLLGVYLFLSFNPSRERFCNLPNAIDNAPVSYMGNAKETRRAENVIKIRSRAQDQLPFPSVFVEQGTAKRRVLLQITPDLDRAHEPVPAVAGDLETSGAGNEILCATGGVDKSVILKHLCMMPISGKLHL
ncbi:hypothetical protein Droror1_Dr00025755 [Drosera rotundifolia]